MNLSSFWHAYDIYPLFIFNVNKNKTLSNTVIERYLFRVAIAMLEQPSCSIHARPTRDSKDRMPFLFQNEVAYEELCTQMTKSESPQDPSWPCFGEKGTSVTTTKLTRKHSLAPFFHKAHDNTSFQKQELQNTDTSTVPNFVSVFPIMVVRSPPDTIKG